MNRFGSHPNHENLTLYEGPPSGLSDALWAGGERRDRDGPLCHLPGALYFVYFRWLTSIHSTFVPVTAAIIKMMIGWCTR